MVPAWFFICSRDSEKLYLDRNYILPDYGYMHVLERKTNKIKTEEKGMTSLLNKIQLI